MSGPVGEDLLPPPASRVSTPLTFHPGVLPMSTASLLDRAEARSDATTTATAAHRLRTTMAAVRVSFTWFGVQKSLTAAQKERAAEAFDAQGQFLSATKKLIDTKHPGYRAVT